MASVIGNNNTNLIISGDFNCIINDKDQKEKGNFSGALKRVTNQLKLNAWEVRNKNRTEFTFIRGQAASI